MRIPLISGLIVGALLAAAASGQTPHADDALRRLRSDAAAVRPLVHASCVHDFLDGTVALPEIQKRTVYYQSSPKAAFTETEAAALPEEQRAKLRKLEFDTARYYDTFYGSPLAYARALDLCAGAGLDSYDGRKILDYGYGTVGHLRLLAGCGAQAIGVDVDPILLALYSEPGDQGRIAPPRPGAHPGTVKLVTGFWPGDEKTRTDSGDGVDLFISKNTLKNGYVHPPAGTDPRRSLTLGVSDDEFVRALGKTVKPGGLVMIYNIGPAPAKKGEPFNTMADIACPFPREALEREGFTILEFDRDDTETIRKFAKALRWDQGEGAMDLETGLFARYTLLRKK